MQYELFKFSEPLPDPNQDTQVCKLCSKEKPVDMFHKQLGNKTGIDTRCKACAHKDRKFLKELRNKLIHTIPEVCNCCDKPSNKPLVVDHCHETLKFRGWLCESCNHGIGKLGDNIEGVQKALDYLRRKTNA